MVRLVLGVAICLPLFTASTAVAQVKLNEEVVKKLIAILGDVENKKAKSRQAAAIFLEQADAGTPGVINALVAALEKDPEPSVRAAAAQVLGAKGEEAKRAIDMLISKLKDDAPEVRQAAARALGGKLAAHAKKAVPALGDTLSNDDPATRTAAAEALKAYGEEALKVEGKLMAAAQDTKLDRFTRIHCAQILIQQSTKAKEVSDALIQMLTEKDAHTSIKQVAVDGLAKFPREALAATDDLVDVYTNDKLPLLLRQSAAVTLAKIRPESKKVWPKVKQLLDDPTTAVRIQTIRLVAKVCKDEPDLVKALIQRTEDGSQETRIAAIQELGELGSLAKAALPALKQIQKTASRDSMRNLATETIDKIEGKKPKDKTEDS